MYVPGRMPLLFLRGGGGAAAGAGAGAGAGADVVARDFDEARARLRRDPAPRAAVEAALPGCGVGARRRAGAAGAATGLKNLESSWR